MTLARWRSLGLPLLAALALHGLWLAGQRLAQPQPTLTTPPAAVRDDTPELVRVARRLTLEHSLRVATPLPPPAAKAAPPKAPPLPRPRSTAKPAVAAAKPKPRPAPPQPISRQRRAPKPPADPEADASVLARLWAQAQPVDEAPGPLASLPAAAQLRQIPEDEARRLGVNQPPLTPQIQAGDLMLAWAQGGALWLLRLPLPSP
jgi:hypothetical protein